MFRDRLVDESDRMWFNSLCATKLKKSFGADWKVEEFKDTICTSRFLLVFGKPRLFGWSGAG